MASMQGNDNDVRSTTAQARSHSQLSSYLECPRAYQLAKVRRIPRRPGAWFPGGTAVHATIERYLQWSLEENE